MFAFPYDVGDYHELEFYRARIEQHRCRFSQGPSGGGRRLWRLAGLLSELDNAERRYQSDVRRRLPDEIDRRLQERLADYRAALTRDAAAMRAGELSKSAFCERYLVDFWRVAATRSRSLGS